LSLIDESAELVDWIGGLRRGTLDEMLIVPLPPAVQPSK
jgi:hypothetical protein